MILRKIERLVSDEWIVVRMSELKAGDIFRMYDDDWDDPRTFEATKDAVLNGDVWGVEVDS